MPRLPTELLSEILLRLLTPTTHHNPTLYRTLLVSRTFFHVAAPILYRAPRIGARVGREAWKNFVDALLEGGVVRYCDMVEEVEDIWLVVGGEESDDDVDELGAVFDNRLTLKNGNSKNYKRDSGISMLLPPPVNTKRYSLPHTLHRILTHCPNLHTLRLHLHSEIPSSLPWSHIIPRLRTLEIYMRITDDFLGVLFKTTSAPKLQTLILHSTNLTTETLSLLKTQTPNLLSITVTQKLPSRHTLKPTHHISPTALSPFLTSHPFLQHLHIAPIPDISHTHLKNLPRTLRTLSLTLSPTLPLPTITHQILPTLPHLTHLTLLAPPSTPTSHYLSDSVVAEEDVLALPIKASKRLYSVTIKGMDFTKGGEVGNGVREFYGVRGMPWAVDALVGRWKRRWEGIGLCVVAAD